MLSNLKTFLSFTLHAFSKVTSCGPLLALLLNPFEGSASIAARSDLPKVLSVLWWQNVFMSVCLYIVQTRIFCFFWNPVALIYGTVYGQICLERFFISAASVISTFPL